MGGGVGAALCPVLEDRRGGPAPEYSHERVRVVAHSGMCSRIMPAQTCCHTDLPTCLPACLPAYLSGCLPVLSVTH